MDKIMRIITEEVQKDGKDSFHYHRYEPTPYAVLETLFQSIPLHKEDVIVDFGCGLGRLNFFCSFHYHCHSVGIEMSREYFERALQNLEAFRGDKTLIDFICCPAQEYIVSPTDTIFYFFNPFSPSIFQSVVSHILDSFYLHPRKIQIILYYPEDETVLYLEQHTDFTLWEEIAACEDIRTDRRERFSIWAIG